MTDVQWDVSKILSLKNKICYLIIKIPKNNSRPKF